MIFGTRANGKYILHVVKDEMKKRTPPSEPNPFAVDLYYVVEYDYETNRDCYGSDCGSLRGDYCRCGTIVNCRLDHDEVPTFLIAQRIAEEYKAHGTELSPVDFYILERLLKLKTTKDNFDFDIGRGYYGEELNAIRLDNADSLWTEYCYILLLEDEGARLRYILKLDYGYIAQNIEDFINVEVVSVSSGQVVVGNQNRYDFLQYEHYEAYADQFWRYNKWSMDNMPICICRRSGDRLVLVDGYHRFKATEGANHITPNYLVLVLS